MTNNLDALMRDLGVIRYRLEQLTTAVDQVWWPPTRRLLMTLKDDIKAGIDSAMGKVRREKDIEQALRLTATALQTQTAAMAARITELEGQAGPWTDADMAEIKDGVQALNTALDPDTVVEAVTANTDVAV